MRRASFQPRNIIRSLNLPAHRMQDAVYNIFEVRLRYCPVQCKLKKGKCILHFELKMIYRNYFLRVDELFMKCSFFFEIILPIFWLKFWKLWFRLVHRTAIFTNGDHLYILIEYLEYVIGLSCWCLADAFKEKNARPYSFKGFNNLYK